LLQDVTLTRVKSMSNADRARVLERHANRTTWLHTISTRICLYPVENVENSPCPIPYASASKDEGEPNNVTAMTKLITAPSTETQSMILKVSQGAGGHEELDGPGHSVVNHDGGQKILFAKTVGTTSILRRFWPRPPFSASATVPRGIFTKLRRSSSDWAGSKSSETCWNHLGYLGSSHIWSRSGMCYDLVGL